MEGKNVPIIVLYIFLAFLAVGLVAVTWFLIQTLQDNADTMSRVQLKPAGAPAEGLPKNIDDSALKLRDVSVSVQSMGDEGSVSRLRAESNRFFALGKQCASKGEFSRAIEYLGKSSKMLEVVSDSGDHQVGDSDAVSSRFAMLGACYYRMGQFDSAEKELTWAINSMPDNAVLYYERALAQRKLKNEYQAMTDWQMAKNLRIDPDRAKDSGAYELMFGKESPDSVMKSTH